MAEEVEFRLYQEAFEESFLWEILVPGEDHRFGDDILIYPALSREDVTASLLAALERGDVSLYAIEDGDRDIPPEEAVRIVGDPAYWDVNTAPVKICLLLSDSGRERFSAMQIPEFERRPRL